MFMRQGRAFSRAECIKGETRTFFITSRTLAEEITRQSPASEAFAVAF